MEVERARADSGGGRGGGIIEGMDWVWIGGMEGIGGISGGILVRAKQMRQRPSKNHVDCDYDYDYDYDYCDCDYNGDSDDDNEE